MSEAEQKETTEHKKKTIKKKVKKIGQPAQTDDEEQVDIDVVKKEVKDDSEIQSPLEPLADQEACEEPDLVEKRSKKPKAMEEPEEPIKLKKHIPKPKPIQDTVAEPIELKHHDFEHKPMEEQVN